MNDLLPCPFCGSTDIDPEGVASFKDEFKYGDYSWSNHEPRMIENRPACNNCSATTDGDWNTRATPQPERVTVKRFVIIATHAQIKWQEFKQNVSPMPLWFHGQYMADNYPNGLIIVGDE